MGPNRNNIKALIKHLQNVKRRKYHKFNMSAWLQAVPTTGNKARNGQSVALPQIRKKWSDVQTAGCLAGECFFRFAPADRYPHVVLTDNCSIISEDNAMISAFAADFLGATSSQLDDDYNPHLDYDFVFSGRWSNAGAPSASTTIDEAIRYLRAVLKTGRFNLYPEDINRILA